MLSIEEALGVLGLSAAQPLDEAAIRKAQRSCSRRHHPDKGGRTEDQQKINQAADLLVSWLSGDISGIAEQLARSFDLENSEQHRQLQRDWALENVGRLLTGLTKLQGQGNRLRHAVGSVETAYGTAGLRGLVFITPQGGTSEQVKVADNTGTLLNPGSQYSEMTPLWDGVQQRLVALQREAVRLGADLLYAPHGIQVRRRADGALSTVVGAAALVDGDLPPLIFGHAGGASAGGAQAGQEGTVGGPLSGNSPVDPTVAAGEPAVAGTGVEEEPQLGRARPSTAAVDSSASAGEGSSAPPTSAAFNRSAVSPASTAGQPGPAAGTPPAAPQQQAVEASADAAAAAPCRSRRRKRRRRDVEEEDDVVEVEPGQLGDFPAAAQAQEGEAVQQRRRGGAAAGVAPAAAGAALPGAGPAGEAGGECRLLPPHEAARQAAGLLQSAVLLWQDRRLHALLWTGKKGATKWEDMRCHIQQRYEAAMAQLCSHYSVRRAAVQPPYTWQQLSQGQAGQEQLRSEMQELQTALLRLMPQLKQPLPPALDPEHSLADPCSRNATIVMACRGAGAKEDCLGRPVAGFPGQALFLVGFGGPLPEIIGPSWYTPADCTACHTMVKHTKKKVGSAGREEWHPPAVPTSAVKQQQVLPAALRVFQRVAESSTNPFCTAVGRHSAALAAAYFAGLAGSLQGSQSGSGGSNTVPPSPKRVRQLEDQYIAVISSSLLPEAVEQQLEGSVRRCSVGGTGCLGRGPDRLYVPFLHSFNAHPLNHVCAACFVHRHPSADGTLVSGSNQL